MRGQDRYEWMRTLSYAPLGQSENVVYQAQELELCQGDRIFFHTRGLDEIEDGEGRPFARERLRRALNESRSGALEKQLREVGDAGGAYADRLDQVGGYALLALEYRRRDRAQAHCLVTADGTGSRKLLEFLRGQLEANDIEGRSMAVLMVVAEELFALCCRQAGGQGRFMAECAVPAGERLVVLRLKGDTGGANPLERLDGEAARHAADFILQHCDRVLAEHEAGMDTITVVKRLEALAPEERERRG